MAKVPLSKSLEFIIEGDHQKDEPRDHLGMSSVGADCSRQVVYQWIWAYDRYLSARMRRLFRRGDYEEDVVVDELNAKGMTVTDQQKEVDLGNLIGHIDGVVHNVPGHKGEYLLLEIKTMNDAGFKKLKKSKDLKNLYPGYWTQFNLYLEALGLQHVLFIVTNKNNESRQYFIFKKDVEHIKAARIKYEAIINFRIKMPERIGSPVFYKCKMCAAADICHRDEDININCRTCKNSSYSDYYQKWACLIKLGDNHLSIKEQQKACALYEKFKGLSD